MILKYFQNDSGRDICVLICDCTDCKWYSRNSGKRCEQLCVQKYIERGMIGSIENILDVK